MWGAFYFLIDSDEKQSVSLGCKNIFGSGDVLWIPRNVQDSTKESLATLGILLKNPSLRSGFKKAPSP